jgi:hypothetical protein
MSRVFHNSPARIFGLKWARFLAWQVKRTQKATAQQQFYAPGTKISSSYTFSIVRKIGKLLLKYDKQ